METRFNQLKIKARNVRALVWDGNTLIDWASGGARYGLDGSSSPSNMLYAFDFDAAVSSPSGEYTVLYTRTGTTGILLRHGQIVRQLSRDFYHAEAYEYPVTFAVGSNGREVLVHCPESYCEIAIEDAETGKRLTSVSPRKPVDVFHSRLAVSPNGKWLLSAGWFWHPLDVVGVFDFASAITDPATLDKAIFSPPGAWELSSAAFLDDDHLMVASSDEFCGEDDSKEDNRPGKYGIALWQIGAPDYSLTALLPHPPGALMPLNARFVVSFYGHPRLVDLQNSETIQEWPNIASGSQTSSIIWDKHPPVMALDRKNARFAVADEEFITIIQINTDNLPR